MTQSPKKRVRRPNPVQLGDTKSISLSDFSTHPIAVSSFVGVTRFSIKEAKEIQKYLGRAIQYLEHKGE